LTYPHHLIRLSVFSDRQHVLDSSARRSVGRRQWTPKQSNKSHSGSIYGVGWRFQSFRIKDLEMVAQIFPQMEPTDQLDASNRRLPASRVAQFAPKRNPASRPSSFSLVNPSPISTSSIGRIGWRWLSRRCFGAAQGQSWGQFHHVTCSRRCAGLAVPRCAPPVRDG
jgi:hypothetical protein